MYDGNELYYVGKSTDLEKSLKQHLKDKHFADWLYFSLYLQPATTNDDIIIKINEWPSDILKLDYLKATIEYATFESKPNFIPENWFLKIAAKLLIPLQAALFALALRNRFRR